MLNWVLNLIPGFNCEVNVEPNVELNVELDVDLYVELVLESKGELHCGVEC